MTPPANEVSRERPDTRPPFRVVLVAPDPRRLPFPPGWLRDADGRTVVVTPGSGASGDGPGDDPPDLRVWLNVPSAVACTARLGAIEVRTGLVTDATTGNAAGRRALIACTAAWRRPGHQKTIELQQLVLPVHDHDSRRDVRDRGREMAMLVARAAVAAVFRRQPDNGSREDALATGLRPLTRHEALRLAVRRTLRRMVRHLTPRGLAKRAYLLFALLIYRPLRDRTRSLRRRHPVRIFTFHRVSDLCRDAMTASRRKFAAQLRYIRNTHRIVTLDEAVELLEDDVPLERPVAVLTFDDAYRSVYDAAAPVVARMGIAACCFAPTAYVGSDDRFPWDRDNPALRHLGVMTWGELNELGRSGWTIGAHTATHHRLVDPNDATVRRELEEPLALLRRRLGLDRVHLAFPFGGPDDVHTAMPRIAERVGYSTCLYNHGGDNRASASRFQLMRIDIGGDHDALAWKARVHGVDAGRLRHRGRRDVTAR